MRLRWTFRAAAIGAAIPLLMLVFLNANLPGLNYVFGALIPFMGYILVSPHDPLIWEGIYFLIPIFMVTNALIYGLAGLLLAQIRLWRTHTPNTTQQESPRP